MTSKDIHITFVGMEPTDALKQFSVEKISKYTKLWKKATSIEIYLREQTYARGVKSDFKVDINVFLPNAKVRVEEVGEDMYANIDKATDTLARRLKRYHAKREYWEGQESWRILEADISNDELDKDITEEEHYTYIPKIVTRKVVKDTAQPISEGEAIERMELSGYNQLLFKSSATGKLTMVYKREQGDYGLVEPESE